jgi:hypothetical protein
MRLKLFVCPMCGVAKLQNVSVGEYPPPICGGDPARVHTSLMSFVYDVTLSASPDPRFGKGDDPSSEPQS